MESLCLHVEDLDKTRHDREKETPWAVARQHILDVFPSRFNFSWILLLKSSEVNKDMWLSIREYYLMKQNIGSSQSISPF